MDVLHLSTSLVSGWAQCQLRGWSGYVERNRHGNDWSSTEPTRFGNVVHDVCERAHELHMAGEEIPPPLVLWDAVWRSWDSYDQDYHALGRDLIEEFLRRTLYEREGDTIGTEVHFVLDLVSMEIALLFEKTPKQIKAIVRKIVARGGVPVMSKIDRIDRVDLAYYVVTDYKTNAQPFTRDEIVKSIQLAIYDMAVRALYQEDLPPGAEMRVKCVYDMLRHGRYDVEFDEDRREEVRAYLINLWHQIAATETPQPRRNTYCWTCELRGNCPEYLSALEMEQPPILTDDLTTPEGIVALVGEWEDLKARQKLIDARVDELGSMLSSLVVTSIGAPVRAGNREVVLAPNPRYEYPADLVFEVFRRHNAISAFVGVANVSNTALDRRLKGLPFRDEIERLKKKGFVKSTVKVVTRAPNLQEEEAE